MKHNLNKSKTVVVKTGGKMNKSERWNMWGQNIEVINKLNDLGLTLENTGDWNKQEALINAKGNLTLIPRTNMKVQTLENI
jgi:hypothetical protein